jgi:energy-coupling factor transport system permease protein
MKFLQDITLGQYMPVDSFVHRLDPRTKFIILMILMIVVFLIDHPLPFLLMGLFIILTIRLSNIPVGSVLRGVVPFFWLFLFAAIAHFFFTPGRSIPPFPIGFVNVTEEGVINGILVSTRIFFIIVLSSLLTLTTTPLELTTALKRVLLPLKAVKVPVDDFVMMMMLTIRFVPILLLESQRIINAQKSRGIDFETGGILSRARKLVPILIPLFHLSFKRADELAVAMVCRGYVTGAQRTSFKELRFTGRDFISMAVVLLIAPFFFL